MRLFCLPSAPRLGALLLVLAVPAAAADTGPSFVYPVHNAGALARGLPLPDPEGRTTVAGTRLQLDWTNEFANVAAGSESLLLDGEGLRLGLRQAWQAGDFGWSIELPLWATGGGMLDSGIETWHDWFGLPNAGREQRPRDEQRYRYVRDGQVRLDQSGGASGLGDLRLGGAWCGAGSGCWRAQLQLPTGDADRLLGGGLGGAAWYERPWHTADAAWSGSLAAGLAAVDGDGALAALQEPVLPFAWLSVGRRLATRWEAGLQFYWHGAAYRDSGLDALQQAGGQLAFGLRYRDAAGRLWNLGLQEDLITESSPDFSIHLAVDW